MRSLSALLLAMLFAIASGLFSCRMRTPDTVHTEPQSEREQKIETLLKDYEQKIKELDTKADVAGGTLREELDRSLRDLKQKHQEAVRKLEDLRAATNRTWKDVNAQLQITLDELKKALDRTREQAK